LDRQKERFKQRLREERQKVFASEVEFDEERNQFLLDKARWEEESKNKDEIIQSLERKVEKLKDDVKTWRIRSWL